jgi:hypothetical protein
VRDSSDTSRLPPAVDPIGRLPGARRRYERRWGFLPFSGRHDLPSTGRTVLLRVEWGRRGREICVMLARWEHRRGRWRRDAVVEHVWLSAEDAEGIGGARHRLGTHGEALEDAEDAARLKQLGELELLADETGHDARAPVPSLVTAAPLDLSVRRELPAPIDPILEQARRSPWFWLPLAAMFAGIALSFVVATSINDKNSLLPLIPLGATFTGLLDLDGHQRRLRRRAEHAAGRFLPAERRRDLPHSGLRTLCRVDHGLAADGATCLMLARWRYRRRRWRRDEVLDHVWLAPGDAAGIATARRRLETRAAAIEREAADHALDPLGHQEHHPRPRTRSRDERAAEERHLADLARELHALDGLVEDLAEDPR